MMNTTIKIMRLLLLPAVIIFVLSGCYKDNIEFVLNEDKSQIDLFFDAVQTLEKVEVFNAGSTHNIIEPDNSIITIAANSFEDAQGNIVENALVHLEYLMLKDKGLLVMYDKPTVSNGELLESGGVFYFEAWNEDKTERYFLRDGHYLEVKSNAVDTQPGMKIFYGENNEQDEFNWDLQFLDGEQWSAMLDDWVFQDSNQIIDGQGYSFLIDSLTWINCDVFNDIPADQKTTACVEMPERFTNNNTVVFSIFTDINSVVGLYGDPDSKKFCEGYSSMPIGYEVTFVTISAMGDDQYYFGMKNAVIEGDHEEFITPEEKSLQEILDILAMF